MRVALITYEYPPDTADGGIATYAVQTARMLAGRGHHVEVFAGSREGSSQRNDSGAIIHRLYIDNRATFSKAVAPVFASRHSQVGFDVLEGPDFEAEAAGACELVPDVPLVVRLHTPACLIEGIEAASAPFRWRCRRRIASAMRGHRPPWHPLHKSHDAERRHMLSADEVVAPSRSMAAWVQRAWGVPAERTTCIPNPFVPSPKLLQIPIESETNIVTYVGRLELRKGVVDLAEAIPKVLRRFPSTIFRFVGRPLSSPRPRMQMDEYLRDRLARFLGSVRIEGPVDPEEIAGVLANTDVCVFPSRFESFGMAAVEGMAAGRGVVCTAGTGLEEVVAGGRCGLLVPPRNPAELAKAICYLLEHPAERMVLGRVAREHVLNAFSWESVGTVQEASYHRAIDRRRGRPLSASAARRAGRAAADVAGLPA